jgi:outer membrane biosynthesis protein TonB
MRHGPWVGLAVVLSGALGAVAEPQRAATVPGLADASVKPPEDKGEGNCDPAEVKKIVFAHRATIRACYERSLTRVPKLHGRLEVTFVIGPDGKVGSADATDGSKLDPELTECVLAEVRSWSFPAPKAGGKCVIARHWVFMSPAD